MSNHIQIPSKDFDLALDLHADMLQNPLIPRKELEREEKVVIDKKEYDLKAEVHKINAFSAHADYKEITDWLSKVDTSKLKKIFQKKLMEILQQQESKTTKEKYY